MSHVLPAQPTRIRGNFWTRTWAVLVKEFIQLKRDRVSFAMIIMVPLIQLLLFGYAINTNPRHLPTAVLLQENSDLGRSILAALKNTDYFNVIERPRTEAELRSLPGIGRYTAGAIASIAFGRPAPVLDGNVVRVLCRYFGIDADSKAPATVSALWELAARLLPARRAGDAQPPSRGCAPRPRPWAASGAPRRRPPRRAGAPDSCPTRSPPPAWSRRWRR